MSFDYIFVKGPEFNETFLDSYRNEKRKADREGLEALADKPFTSLNDIRVGLRSFNAFLWHEVSVETTKLPLTVDEAPVFYHYSYDGYITIGKVRAVPNI